jgi:hypothetical protein
VEDTTLFEALLAELFTATLNGAPALAIIGRNCQQWDEVDRRPAILFLGEGFEHASQTTYCETKRHPKAIA